MEERDYYTAKEAQEILGMTYSGLRNLVNTERIRSVTPPGKRQAVYVKDDVNKVQRGEKGERDYYTAKEAQEILGMTYSGLRNQVIAGNLRSVIPDGKRQAVYVKDDVDRLKSEMEAWLISRHQVEIPSAQFFKATIEDIPGAVALAAEVFGGLNTIPVEKRIEWLRKNPDIDYLLKQEDQLVGYLSLVPLRPETIEDLLSLKHYAKDLTEDDILPYEANIPVDIYGMAIGIRPGVSLSQKRAWGERLILGARKVVLDLGDRGIAIRRIVAHSFTPDGIRLMRHIGFMETPPKAPGLRDFLIDVESSGIPFIREYNDKLKQWRNRNRPILRFAPSTDSDLWTRVQNSRRIYGEEDTVSYERVLEWKELNNKIFMSVKEGDKLVGAITIMPLDELTIHALIDDTIREKDIPDWAIKEWTDQGLSVYIPTIAIVPSGNKEVDSDRGAFLIRSTIRWALDLNRKYDIKNWYAIAATDEGEKLLQHLGFKHIEGARKGYKVDNIKRSRGLLKSFLDKIEGENAGELLTHSKNTPSKESTSET